MIRNKVQIYSEYTNMKYPLSDTHEEDIPFGLLVDAAVSTPQDYMEVSLTTFVRTTDYVYLCLEAGEEPIAHLIVTDPEAFTIYPLTMFGDGAGWVVFGPDIQHTLTIKEIAVPLDPRCVMPNLQTQNQFKLSVNGFVYDMPNTLNIRTNDLVAVSNETRSYNNRPGPHTTVTEDNILTLRRNDLYLSPETLANGMKVQEDGLPLYFINGIGPDAKGNITLEISNGSVTAVQDISSENTIGVVLGTDGVPECDGLCEDGGDKNLRSLLQIGQANHGEPYVLPLDTVVEPCTEEDIPEDPYGDCD
jgi:hypothetical protein